MTAIDGHDKMVLKTSISPLVKSQIGGTDIYTPCKVKHTPELVADPIPVQNTYEDGASEKNERRSSRRRRHKDGSISSRTGRVRSVKQYSD